MSRHFMRILALGLSLTMMLSSAPAMVMAEEEDGAPVTTSPVATAREKIDAVLRREAIEDDSILMENQFGRDGRQVLSADVSSLEYTVEIPSAGKYRLWFAYYSLSDGFTNIERRVSMDGGESVLLYLSKHWVNKDEEIQIDKSGNELRPEQTESREWIDAEAKIDGTAMPALFELAAGPHTLTIQGVREDMLISRVYFVEERDLPAYNAYRCMYENGSGAEGRLIDKVQGEDALRKSDPMLYPQYDRSSPLTEPVSDKTIRMNTIGGTNWKTVGQWIEWPVTVERSGYYVIALRARQNLRSGAVSSRRLTIDGEVPFREAENLSFSYSSDWQTAYLGSEDGPYLFYLEAGTNTLRLEAVIGDLLTPVETVQECSLELNRIYREILMVVGTSADANRDYEFEAEIPETLENIKIQREVLAQAKEAIIQQTGKTGENLAVLDNIILQLDIMSKNPRKIPKTYLSFRDNVSALGSWLNSAWEQPLEIDYLMVTTPGYDLPKGSASFFSGVAHEIRMFLYSFINDYTGSTEASSEEDIKAWLLTSETVASGREQATIINRLISSSYRHGNVSLSVVAGASLLPSVLSGKSPDVVFNLYSADVMNYAARSALADLSALEQDGTLENFSESALLPLRFNGTLYGVPETQKFNVLFYRRDILDDLGISVPETWEEMYAILPILQRNNMFFGLPQGYASYPMFLYQAGGRFYSDDQRQCLLSSDDAVNAFVRQTRFFTDYGMPLDFDFANRFRSGECPVAVADYTNYNLLSVFAPEIKGLWSFTLVPGTTDEEGNVHSLTGSTSTSAAIMAGTDKMEASLRFMRWWASAETQGSYGREQEVVLGAAGRYAPANREAIRMLPWNTDELNVIYAQLEQTMGVPEVPGGYYMSRYVDFAFRKAVIAGEDPREALLGYVEDINDEILYKRQEFKLD